MARLRREIKKTDKFQRVNRREEGRGKRGGNEGEGWCI
jgi:hypothetical protein